MKISICAQMLQASVYGLYLFSEFFLLPSIFLLFNFVTRRLARFGSINFKLIHRRASHHGVALRLRYLVSNDVSLRVH